LYLFEPSAATFPPVPPPSNSIAYVSGSLRLDDELQNAGVSHLSLRCCGYMPKNKNWNFSHVFSPFWRLYHNFSTGHRVVYGQGTILLTPARFVLIPENVLFHCVSSGNLARHLYIHFNLLPGQTALLDTPVIVQAKPLAAALANRLAHAIVHSPPCQVGHLALSLLHWVLGTLPGERPVARSTHESLRKTLAWIGSHLGEDLSNPVLARAAGGSVRGLVRMFEREIHVSPQSYVREIRLREAARRLAHGNDTIDRIAEDLGFPNRYYFTRRFSGYLGRSPGEFRKTMREKKDELIGKTKMTKGIL
jgi:AraC family transcriptional regulator, arabinose operon regulatory protein